MTNEERPAVHAPVLGILPRFVLMFVWMGSIMLLFATVAIGRTFGLDDDALWLAFGAAEAPLILVVVGYAFLRNVSIEAKADGLVIANRLGRRRFVPYRSITSVTATTKNIGNAVYPRPDSGLTIETHGKSVNLVTGRAGVFSVRAHVDPARDAMVRQIRVEIENVSARGDAPVFLAQLTRGARSTATGIQELRALASAEEGYRGSQIGDEDRASGAHR